MYYVSVTTRHSLTNVKRLDSALEEHRKIYEEIMDGDIDGAKHSIREHITKTQMLVRKYYASKNQE